VVMSKILGLAAVLLIHSHALAQVLGFSLSDGRKKIQMPIEVYNNLVVVPVILNGQLPLKFILDTGVRTSILTQKTFSDILNLSYTRKYTIAGPGGQKLVDAYVTNNVSIDLPGVHGEGHALLVLDEDYLELRNYLGTDVHGILGYELFSRFIVKIDYEAKILTLSTPDRARIGRRYRSFPITIEDTKPYITTNIELNDSTQITSKLLIDSGASHGLVLEPGSHPKLTVPSLHIKSIIGRGIGGIITGQIGRIKSITLGGYKVHNVVSNFPDPNSYMDTLKMGRIVFRNGSIGGELLSRFTVVFDFPQEKIYLKKNHDYKKKFYFNLSGVTLKAKGSSLRKYEITDIRENSSAAQAGLQTGDLIISVNGIATEELDLNSINGFLNSKPGRRITLDIERTGQRLRKILYLTLQI
jgi:PDZ domain/Aspartyl protease